MARTWVIGSVSFFAGIATIIGVGIGIRSMQEARVSSDAMIEELQRIRLEIANTDFSQQAIENVNALLTEVADLEDTLIARVQIEELESDAYISRIYEGVFDVKPDQYFELQTPSGKIIDLFYRQNGNTNQVFSYVDGRRLTHSVGGKLSVGLAEESCQLTLISESDLQEVARYRFRCDPSG